MLLAINANNTNIKFGVVRRRPHRRRMARPHSAMRTADEHAVWLTAAHGDWRASTRKSITDAIIGQRRAAGQLQPAPPVRRAISRREPLFVGEPNVDLGIKVRSRPQDAGADRSASASSPAS